MKIPYKVFKLPDVGNAGNYLILILNKITDFMSKLHLNNLKNKRIYFFGYF